MPRPKDTTAIVTYGDHEIITPENKLSVAVSKTPGQSGDDPIARAEKALADLSTQFASWMDAECDRLDKARLELAKNPDASSKDVLFHAAHDIKGEAATFGFPASSRRALSSRSHSASIQLANWFERSASAFSARAMGSSPLWPGVFDTATLNLFSGVMIVHDRRR